MPPIQLIWRTTKPQETCALGRNFIYAQIWHSLLQQSNLRRLNYTARRQRPAGFSSS